MQKNGVEKRESGEKRVEKKSVMGEMCGKNVGKSGKSEVDKKSASGKSVVGEVSGKSEVDKKSASGKSVVGEVSGKSVGEKSGENVVITVENGGNDPEIAKKKSKWLPNVTFEDKDALMGSAWLSNNIIVASMTLMKQSKEGKLLKGLQSPLYGNTLSFSKAGRSRYIQILNVGKHWVTVSNISHQSAEVVHD